MTDLREFLEWTEENCPINVHFCEDCWHYSPQEQGVHHCKKYRECHESRESRESRDRLY